MAQSNGKHYVYAAVSAAEVDLLKTIAQKDGLSLSNFVRRCINGYLLELGDDSLPMLDEIEHVGRKRTMPKRSEPKTPEQLEREIAYYAQAIQRTTSADRIQRAHIAIRKREQLLVEARRVRIADQRT